MIKIFFVFHLIVFSYNIFAQNPLFKIPLSERIANYDISVTLDTIENKLTGKEILHWKNTSTEIITELRFHLYLNAFQNNRSTFMIESGGKHRGFGKKENIWGWTKISSMKILDGEDLTDNIEFIQPDDKNSYDQTVISVPLGKPLNPNEEIKLEINFISKLPNIFARTGFAKDYYFVGQWFPKIGVYESAEKLNADKGRWNCHQFHLNSEFYADFGVYNVDITLPEKFIVGATGLLEYEKKNEDGTKFLRFHAEDVIDFAWTAYPRFLSKEKKWEHVNVKVLLPPEHFMHADRYLNSAIASLEYLDKNVGKYSYPNLTIVDPPFRAMGSGGMEYPTLITVMSLWNLPTGIKLIEIVTVHEFAHNYFMGMLASNEFEEPWLDEGFTQYFETKIMDATYGNKQSFLNIWGYQIGDFEMTRAGYVGMKNPSISSNSPYSWQFPRGAYGRLTYNKTATWLTTLERMLGNDTMTEVIKTYFTRWSFKHPNGENFIEIVNEIVAKNHGLKFGENLDWFFNQVVYGSGVCDYKISTIRNVQANRAEGFFNDSLIIASKNANEVEKKEQQYNSEVIIHRVGDVKLPVEVLIHFKNGDEILEYWSGQERTKTFYYNEDHKIEWAKLDPKNKITLDVNISNNSYTLTPEKTVVDKYTAKFLFWIENVMLAIGMLF
ncbi:MAG: M1 family metallopeptidase [Ignavibacteriae bacterium]|nr:M1 family metallopeptidase [Ignavibacteriota bacterium]